MIEYADLEIGLHRHDDQSYRLEPSLILPADEASHGLPGSTLLLTEFDRGALNTLLGTNDLTGYGTMLGEKLLPPRLLALLTQGRSGLTNNPPVPLRIRLKIGPSAPELHHLRWETLRDPTDTSLLLAADTRQPFSRYLTSSDSRPVRLSPKGSLRALVVAANPAPRPGDNLAPVEVEKELERARKALQSIKIDTLCSIADPDRLGPPTLKVLVQTLGQDYDILYLICHGKLIQGTAKIWLEDDNGQVDVVSVEDEDLPNGVRRPGLATQIGGLTVLPRLLVLASCESSGSGVTADGGVLAAMGPRLVDVGIPAVVAMQGSITMTSVESFMPRFFEVLRDEGLVDLAVSAARKDLLSDTRPDWWMPVLFMRLRSGRIWYEPGFAGEKPDFETWPDLVQAIHDKRCTPIIGPGMLEFLIGPTSQLASRWADTQNFPMAPFSRTDLPRVARYLATIQSPAYPTGQFSQYLLDELWRRHGDKLNGFTRASPLTDLIKQVGTVLRQENENDPYRVLASLPIEVYLTTTPDDLLLDALNETGVKDPQVALCPWNRDIEQPDSAFEADPNYKPSVTKPLVYYLFGRLDQPDSLVISEDDYFNYLIWSIADQNRGTPFTPPSVSKVLARNALLFLGFEIDDWDFRVLFHSITNPEGGQPRRPKSVAVQITPDETSFLQPRQARKYLEKYYSGFRVNTNVFWGRGPDFLRQVWERRDKWQV